MQDTIMSRLSHAWNVFRNKEPTSRYDHGGHSSSNRPDKYYSYHTNEKSIVNSIYNRIATDVSTLDFRHVRLDDNGLYKETINSSLNELFSLQANIDQTGRAFVQDAIHSMCDEGAIALVPIDTGISPSEHAGFDIYQARVGRIVEWYPEKVRVEVYNQATALPEEVVVNKDFTPIIENPFYAIMNEPTSILKRLVEKINLLDVVDQRSNSGKLDMIIQLPYTIKTKTKEEQAEKRKKNIEMQMTGSKLGIAYIDAAEKITQLNRAVTNDLVPQVEYLTKMLYNELGLTAGIFDGTADEKEVLNYYNRTIEPFANAMIDEVRRKWLTKTGRSQKQSFDFFRDMFKLIPISELAEIADKLTRNAILSSNEFRGIVGYKPVDTKEANELSNKNLNKDNDSTNIKIEDEVKRSIKKGEKNKDA